jgi:hypothetical protein
MPIKSSGRAGEPTEFNLEVPDTKLFTVAQRSGDLWNVYVGETGKDGMVRTLACYPSNRRGAEDCALAVALALEGVLTGDWKNYS